MVDRGPANDVVDRLPVNQTFFRALVTAEVFRLTGRNLDDLERDTLGDYLGPTETLDPVRGASWSMTWRWKSWRTTDWKSSFEGRPMVDRNHELFDPGQCGVTPGALSALESAGVDAVALIHRHASGDWGEHGTFHETTVTDDERRRGAFATADDAKLNRLAVEQNDGSRVMSEYRLPPDDTRVWVVTEGEPGARNTVVTLPEEY